MRRFCGLRAGLALALGLALLTPPAPGDARQAPAQLRLEPAGCPSGYVHLTGGQCVQRSLAEQYSGDEQELDPRSTGFRPVRRRDRPWTGAWDRPVLAASRPEPRRLPPPGPLLESRRPPPQGPLLQQRSGPVETVRRPPGDGQRRRGHRRGQHRRRGGGRGGGAPGRREDGESSPPVQLTAAGDPASVTEPTCASGQMDARGRCRDGRRMGGKPGKQRERGGRRRGHRGGRRGGGESRWRHRRPCKEGFTRSNRGQCVPAGDESSNSTAAGTSDPTSSPDMSVADQLEESPEQAQGTTTESSPRRRNGQRRRGGHRRRHGGRGRRPEGQTADGGSDGVSDSGRPGSEAQDGARPRENRLDRREGGRAAGGRRSCPPGQVRWRRGRCVSADRLHSCPPGSQRKPGGRCVRCELLPLPEDGGRCPADCAQTGDKCACCQPSRRGPPTELPQTEN